MNRKGNLLVVSSILPVLWITQMQQKDDLFDALD
jgi:hypothetical protein